MTKMKYFVHITIINVPSMIHIIGKSTCNIKGLKVAQLQGGIKTIRVQWVYGSRPSQTIVSRFGTENGEPLFIISF